MDLKKLDEFLGVPHGASKSVIVEHQEGNLELLRRKLKPYGIEISDNMFVKNESINDWDSLVERLGLDQSFLSRQRKSQKRDYSKLDDLHTI